MTLDVLQFIDNKGGNAEEIRESQRKRGHPVELVDEIIQMYSDWVKSMSFYFFHGNCNKFFNPSESGLRDKRNEEESERGAEGNFG